MRLCLGGWLPDHAAVTDRVADICETMCHGANCAIIGLHLKALLWKIRFEVVEKRARDELQTQIRYSFDCYDSWLCAEHRISPIDSRRRHHLPSK